MSRNEIVASGVGGQGLVSFANVLAEAATSVGKNVCVTTAYGAESRGTFTKADLVISDTSIAYPECEDPDIVLCFAQVAYERYYRKMKEGSILIFDDELVQPSDDSKAKQYGQPFTSIARDMGREGSANIVATGYLLKLTGMLKLDDVEKALTERFGKNKKANELNISMIRAGAALE